MNTAALLTKFTPEGGKAVIRPYTPVSDEGKLKHQLVYRRSMMLDMN